MLLLVLLAAALRSTPAQLRIESFSDNAIREMSGGAQLAFAGAAAKGQHDLSDKTEKEATMGPAGDFTDDMIKNPNNLVFGPSGELYVSSFTLDHVLRFDAFVRTPIQPQLHAKYQVFARELDGPSALAIDPSQQTSEHQRSGLFVASFGGDEVFRFAPNGTILRRFGNEEEVDCPEGVAVGPDGLLYVSSWHRGWLVRYNITTGAFLGQFGTMRSAEFGGTDANKAVMRDPFLPKSLPSFAKGRHSFPEELAFTREGHLLVSYFYSSSLIRYNGTDGAELDVQLVGSAEDDGDGGSSDGASSAAYQNDKMNDMFTAGAGGFGPSKKMLRGPVGIAIGPDDGDIYVCSQKRNVVMRLVSTSRMYYPSIFAHHSPVVNS